jgi:Protein of unknown function (DUF3662)/FHA domain
VAGRLGQSGAIIYTRSSEAEAVPAMSVLRSIEGKIEGLVEGLFGRAFRAHVQPVELARKLAKEMDEHRSVSVSRVYVPNEYTVFLSPRDRAQFASYEGSLIGELQEYLMEHARRERYALLSPARVMITADEDLAIGEFGIAARVVSPDQIAVAPAAATPSPPPVVMPPPAAAVETPPIAPVTAPAVTTIYRPAEPLVADPPPVETKPTVTLTHQGIATTITSSRAVIGRSKDCDVHVVDANVSRRHCEVIEEGDAWFVVDLGSTNGTEVNGLPVKRARLSNGDRITIGSSDLLFGRAGA